jgi:hypothetical protein
MTSQVLPVTASPPNHGLHGAHGFRPRTLGASEVAAS